MSSSILKACDFCGLARDRAISSRQSQVASDQQPPSYTAIGPYRLEAYATLLIDTAARKLLIQVNT